jgi:hypothetical protein
MRQAYVHAISLHSDTTETNVSGSAFSLQTRPPPHPQTATPCQKTGNEDSQYPQTILKVNASGARGNNASVNGHSTVAAAAGKPKTLYITGAFYTGTEVILGMFNKYFNKSDHIIKPNDRCFVHTTVKLCRIFHLFPVADRDPRLPYLMQTVFPGQGSHSILRMTLILWEIFAM